MDFFLNFVDPELVKSWAMDTLKTDFAKMTMAFTIAAWLHRGWVKKDIKSYFNALTAAIDNVAEKVGTEVSSVKKDIAKITTRVEALEKRGEKP